jgi:hypothetical protein
MRDENFMHAVNEIAAFLGSKEVPPHTKAAWLEKVRNIPDEALAYIVAKITDECDNMPRNLPKVFKEKFRAWQMENPGKVAAIVEGGCRDCESGVLFLERDGKTGTIFCQCYQGNAGYLGRSTLAYMESQGWQSTKAKTIGPGFKDKSELAAQLARARKDEAKPHPDRYDPYEDRYDAENW